MTAPYMSISVQLDTPDAPRVNGRPVRVVSWTATRYPGGKPGFSVYAHHPESADPADAPLTVLLCTNSLANPDVPAWVPRPPSGWLASLRMTAEPDRVAQASTALMAGGVW